ncbi:MAG TPA: AAA family ATPase [Vicinamibacterales bacterium]
MYKAFFGLRERPFDLTANPRFLYLSKGHREALSLLHYGIAGDKGITLLLGEAGTGKTTLLRAVAQHQTDGVVQLLHLHNPLLTREELFEFLAHELHLHPSYRTSKSTFLRLLHHALEERRAAGRHTALVIDEAQSLPDDLFEEIRLMANLESAGGKLLSVVLTGQPELAQRLNQPHLRAFKQRVALRTLLLPFSLQETAAYIATRVQVAGGSAAAMFAAPAVESIHRASRGLPRTISVICDNALIAACALKQTTVSEAVVAEVCGELDLEVPSVMPPGHVLAVRVRPASGSQADATPEAHDVAPLLGQAAVPPEKAQPDAAADASASREAETGIGGEILAVTK